MTHFNPQHGLIVVTVRLFGHSGEYGARLALDTGASSTVISKEILITIGYDPDALPKTVNFTTGSGVSLLLVLALTSWTRWVRNG